MEANVNFEGKPPKPKVKWWEVAIFVALVIYCVGIILYKI